VTRIAELIENPSCFTEEPCDLIIDGDLSIRKAVHIVLDAGAESLGISHPSFGQPVFLSRSQLLELLVKELDAIQEKVNNLQIQLEQQLQNQIELMEIGAACFLDAKKNKLESAVQNLNEGVILLNESGQAEQINQVAARMLDLPEAADQNQINEALEQIGYKELIQSRESDPSDAGEFQIKSRNQRLLRIRWKRIYDEWRHPLGLSLFLYDIADEIAAENTKNDFITAISHELRTPLTSIQNSVSNILAGVTGKVADKTRQYLYAMKMDCHRFADLINDLLDVAKLEAGNMPITRKVMDLDALIRTAVKEFHEESVKAGIQLNCQTAGTITPIFADVKKIHQVLRNLIRNAIQFTPAGGQITVSLEPQGSSIVTCVRDTGVGISQDIQKYIFTKFYQVARQAGPGFKGSGLGLAICKGIIQIHGGSIWLESEPSKGSRFYFSLPKTDPQLFLHSHLKSLSKEKNGAAKRMALLMVRFEGADSLCQMQPIRDSAGQIINDLLAQSRFFLTCGTDLAIQTDDCEITFLINEFGQQKIEKVCKRIEKMILHHLKKNFSDASILPMMATAEYPLDAADPVQLSAQARAKLTKIACTTGSGDRE